MRRLHKRRSTRMLSVVSILAVISMLALSARVNTRNSAAQDKGPTTISTGSDSARSKLNPTLIQTLDNAPDSSVMVHAYVMAGTDLSAYMPDALPRAWTSPDGLTIISGTVQARNLEKLASVDGVLVVDPMQGAYAPDLAPDSKTNANVAPSAKLQSMMTQAIKSGQRNNVQTNSNNDVSPSSWADVLNTHHSKAAWDKGFTGTGVKAMINDSGVDFAHPDLYGTWATVDDPESPYFGWPMQFDALSMLLYAQDMILGTTNITDGLGYYADTSTVVTEADPTFQTFDAPEPRTYTLTGTSMSGEYRMGTHPDNSLRPWYFIATGQEQGEDDIGERPAILVVDEHEAGVYDTVYVDLDFDNDFSDETAMNKDNPVAGADWWGAYDPAIEDFSPEPDGLFDISAGMVYWITDGVNPIPAADWWYGLGVAGNGVQDDGEAGAGDMVLFSVLDFAQSPGGDHGQLVASNVAAQGVINADAINAVLEPDTLDGQTAGINPPYKPADTGGMVQGAGKDVKLVSAGDFYSFGGFDAHVFAALGYDGVPGTGDDIQLINNSWGSGGTHNDGWDAQSRVIDSLTRPVNPTLLTVISAGNASPGFGTVSSPTPPNALIVGASTQYGSTGWDSATGADQITYGDISSFSSRGPGARGDAAVDIVGDGARASGNIPLNEAMSGAHAWETWGGTSRSAPVVVGNAALVYQAYHDTFGLWPTSEMAKTLLMSGATDLHYDPFLQGAGSVNALRSVDLVTGEAGSFVFPFDYRAGDYRGDEYPGFANIMLPGGTDQQAFQVANPTDQTEHLTVTDQWLQKIGDTEFDWTSAPISEEPIDIVDGHPDETSFDWNTPQYLWNVTDQIPEDADLVVLRFNYTMDQFDPEQSYQWEQTNSWYLTGYDWTDVDGDGQLWTDTNGNGVVDDGEIDKGEYVRTEYSNQRATTHQITVQRPLERMHDGLMLGLQHSQARMDVPQTSFTIGMDFYKQVDMPWISVERGNQLSVPALSTGQFKVNVDVPGDARPGIYEAELKVGDGFRDSIVPVTINIASDQTGFQAGEVEFDENTDQSFYNNRLIYGSQSWRGDQASGDWRFYYSDLPDEPGLVADKMPDGSYSYLADVDWGHLPTDVDAYLMSGVPDQFSDDEGDYFGPYGLDVTASSNNTYTGDGVYRIDTSSGANHEVIAGPYTPGLNVIAIDNTNYAGDTPTEQVSVRTGVMGVSENPISVASAAGSSMSSTQSVVSSIGLSGLNIQGYGLSKPDQRSEVPIQQDNPNDPSTSSFTQELTLENAGLLDIQVSGNGEDDDIDLYLIKDLNGDGEFDFATEQIASSTTATADEHIRIQLPEDGDYLVAVHGWAVPGGDSTFEYSALAVQGAGVQASGVPEGAIQPFRVYDFGVDFNTEGLEAGDYTGLLTIGPPEGPSAVLVFVDYTIQ